MATSVPLWVAATIAVGSPLLTFGGVLLTLVLNRATAREVDARWRREETMRLLRWAADHAVDPDPRRARLGLAGLHALGRSPLLQPEDQQLVSEVFVEAVLMRRDLH
jgi:hypothetical protein